MYNGMRYEKEIIQILQAASGEGLSVRKISRHVFNACNSFFNTISYEEVHHDVSQYLIRHSKMPDSMIQRVGGRGIYRLNVDSCELRQLMLEFTDDADLDSKEDQQHQDQSLPLFPDED